MAIFTREYQQHHHQQHTVSPKHIEILATSEPISTDDADNIQLQQHIAADYDSTAAIAQLDNNKQNKFKFETNTKQKAQQNNNNKKHKTLLAQQRAQFVCQSRGSRPPAMISWYKEDSGLIEGIGQSMSESGYVTTSILNFLVRPEDNGKRLTCQARNEAMAGGQSESSEDEERPPPAGLIMTSVILNVLCK